MCRGVRARARQMYILRVLASCTPRKEVSRVVVEHLRYLVNLYLDTGTTVYVEVRLPRLASS